MCAVLLRTPIGGVRIWSDRAQCRAGVPVFSRSQAVFAGCGVGSVISGRFRAAAAFLPPFSAAWRHGRGFCLGGDILAALPSYIPSKDANLNSWLANFSSLLSASPATYGQTSGTAASVASAVAAWSTAYSLVTSPTTKTAATVSAKNTAKVRVLATVRPIAQNISLNAGVASSDKIAIGVNPRTSTPSPITPPTSNPVLVVQSAAQQSIILRYRDSAASVSVKAKPYGVKQCRIVGGPSATAVTDPTTLPFLVQATKSPVQVTTGSAAVGTQFYFAAQWVTQTGGVSPWSPIINFTIPGSK